MVSDAEIVERLQEILQTADLTTTTTASIRRKLEEELGVNLSDKKAFIREQVDLYLANQQEDQDGDGQQSSEQPTPDNDDNNGNNDEEEEEDDDDDEGSSEGNSNASKKRGSHKEKKKRRASGGFAKLCGLSSELQAIVGEPELARTEVVKMLWNYIRENKLQDPENKRIIKCDDKFRAVFGTDSVDMFQMNKILSNHLQRLDSENVGSEQAKPKAKRQKPEKKDSGKVRVSGFLSPIPLSDALANFIGTGERQMSRSEVVKRIWDYIKDNQLQDPSDKRNIVCDSKLRELFGCDRFVGFSVSKLLKSHFIKT